MVNAVIYLTTLLLIPPPTLAITRPRPHHRPDALRNFRRHAIPSPLDDWEPGLREATYQALVREHRATPSLHHHISEAPMVGRQYHAVPFGDITILARGRLYSDKDDTLRFVQDPYQNDCEDCHNQRFRCEPGQCEGWNPYGGEKLVALWTVKRIRHRDPNLGHRYEIEYTIAPLGSTYTTPHDGFDYDSPGHVFIVKTENQYTDYTPQAYPDVNNAYHNNKLAFNLKHYESPYPVTENQVGGDEPPAGGPGFGYFKPGTYNGANPQNYRPHSQEATPVYGVQTEGSTVVQQVESTERPREKEVQLYQKLINALALKTSTPQTPPPYHADIFDPNFRSTTGKTPQTTTARLKTTTAPAETYLFFPDESNAPTTTTNSRPTSEDQRNFVRTTASALQTTSNFKPSQEDPMHLTQTSTVGSTITPQTSVAPVKTTYLFIPTGQMIPVTVNDAATATSLKPIVRQQTATPSTTYRTYQKPMVTTGKSNEFVQPAITGKVNVVQAKPVTTITYFTPVETTEVFTTKSQLFKSNTKPFKTTTPVIVKLTTHGEDEEFDIFSEPRKNPAEVTAKTTRQPTSSESTTGSTLPYEETTVRLKTTSERSNSAQPSTEMLRTTLDSRQESTTAVRKSTTPLTRRTTTTTTRITTTEAESSDEILTTPFEEHEVTTENEVTTSVVSDETDSAIHEMVSATTEPANRTTVTTTETSSVFTVTPVTTRTTGTFEISRNFTGESPPEHAKSSSKPPEETSEETTEEKQTSTNPSSAEEDQTSSERTTQEQQTSTKPFTQVTQQTTTPLTESPTTSRKLLEQSKTTPQSSTRIPIETTQRIPPRNRQKPTRAPPKIPENPVKQSSEEHQNIASDIFGEEQPKPTLTTEKQTKIFEEDDFLFGTQSSMTPQTHKVIFENFFEASTAPNSAERTTITDKPTATTIEEPQTALNTKQSYITSTSFEVNKRNRSQTTPVSATVMANVTEVADDDEYKVFKTEDPPEKKLRTKKAFDQVALSLVNHARAVDILSKRTRRERKYSRRRTYTPRSKGGSE